jgi:glycerol-3-phosphate acyltransferase PlsY
MQVLACAIGTVLSYFIGSIPFGYLVGRMGGVDIRRCGSRNVGATNVARVLGWRRGVSVLVLDGLKGAAAVGLVGGLLWKRAGTDRSLLMALCGAGVILGHTFTCWLRFKGGKGVAAALGAWLVLAPAATLTALAAWLVTVAVWRYVSLGSIVASIVLPVALAILNRSSPATATPELVFAGLLTVLVIVRHYGNILRLLAGTENKIGRTSAGDARTPKPDTPPGERRHPDLDAGRGKDPAARPDE